MITRNSPLISGRLRLGKALRQIGFLNLIAAAAGDIRDGRGLAVFELDQAILSKLRRLGNRAVFMGNRIADFLAGNVKILTVFIRQRDLEREFFVRRCQSFGSRYRLTDLQTSLQGIGDGQFTVAARTVLKNALYDHGMQDIRCYFIMIVGPLFHDRIIVSVFQRLASRYQAGCNKNHTLPIIGSAERNRNIGLIVTGDLERNAVGPAACIQIIGPDFADGQLSFIQRNRIRLIDRIRPFALFDPMIGSVFQLSKGIAVSRPGPVSVILRTVRQMFGIQRFQLCIIDRSVGIGLKAVAAFDRRDLLFLGIGQ